MLGVMHVLVRDDLIDHEYVSEHALGFEELAAHVASWDPVRAAKVCGIEADEIEELTRAYGTTPEELHPDLDRRRAP